MYAYPRKYCLKPTNMDLVARLAREEGLHECESRDDPYPPHALSISISRSLELMSVLLGTDQHVLTVVPADEAVSVLGLELAVRVLLRLLHCDIHVTV